MLKSMLRAAMVVAAVLAPTWALADGGGPWGLDEIRGGVDLSSIELEPHSFVLPNPQSFENARLDSVSVDLLFKLPDQGFIDWIGSPRLDLGGVVNLGGFEDTAHAGLNWHLPLGKSPFFWEAGLGLGLHTGYDDGAPPGFRNLGCPVLLHYDYGMGVNVNDHVTAMLQLQHTSSVYICEPNDGLNHVGLVVGWKF